MSRAKDEPIPPEERLFHALLESEVAGDTILHLSLQISDLIPRCSVWREKYCQPREAFKGKPGVTYSHLACVRPRDLPPDVEVELPNPNPRKAPVRRSFRFVAADDPTPSDDAHAEVRAARLPDLKVKAVDSELARNALRVELAMRFQLVPIP